MIPFVRKRDGIHLTLSSGERDVLESLTSQLLQILGTGLQDDPVAHRMFPSAYPDDPEAAAEFRRYTFDDLQAQKTENARVVHAWLTGTTSGVFDERAEQAWLRTLTDLRLTVAERLGIADTDPEDGTDPDGTGAGTDDGFGLRDVYDWLGYVQEHLVVTLTARQDEDGREARRGRS
ncbi:DUF2017 family protein [Curtobacterium sp. Leaf261]|uniref:DUF2017 family protein n=1 Tax=Curtobacterium sp. Leaf261 TaxID=1736311 RepID=UPI0007008388|nr:DUF2017 family protein [Curtobacterium sp. Leaf261]KQO63511.1 hypothetical protein ASF23_04485 [Curtobacterium sp. Leaf261]